MKKIESLCSAPLCEGMLNVIRFAIALFRLLFVK